MNHALPPAWRLLNLFAPIRDGVWNFTRLAALPPILFARPRNGDNEFAVFLGDKVFALAG
jgi:hypothetical protein